MNNKRKCLRCDSMNLIPSDIQSTGKVYARPKDAKPIAILTSGVPLSANICADCGHTEMVVNPEQIKKILKSK